MPRRLKVEASIPTIAAALICGTPAIAQDQDSGNRKTGGLEEIIVTAQKRAENVQDVPAAIITFDAERIANSRVEEFSDVIKRIPSLSVNSVTPGSSFVSLRGAAVSQPSVTGGQSVGLVIDDISYTTSADWDLSLYDVERIEVLRGPQGTLFGRNVVGGVLNIVTKAPEDEFGGYLSATVGNYNRIDLRGAINIPLADDFLTKLTFFRMQNDGTSYNNVTGNDVEDTYKYGLRLQTVYEGGDWQLAINGEYMRQDSTGAARDYVGPASYVPEYADYVPDNDPRVVSSQFDPEFDDEAWNVSGKLTIDFDSAQFVAISAYRDRKQHYLSEYIGVPISPFWATNDVDLSQFSQELRLVSTDGGPLKWTVGAFYMNLEVNEANVDHFSYAPETLLGILTACRREGGASSAFCLARFGDIPADPRFVEDPVVSGIINTKSNSYALFGEGTLEVTDDLNVTAGLRYTYEDVKGTAVKDGDYQRSQAPEGPFTTSFGKSFDAFTYRVSTDYKIAPDKMVYATVSRGFKAGVFVLNETAALTSTPIKPEFAMNYEIGAKTQWLDNRLRFNLAAFKTDYTDQQVFLTTSEGKVVVENAGKVKVKGVEVDLEAAPVENLVLWASYAYSEGVIRNLPGFDGAKPAQLPPHAFTIGAALTVPSPELAGSFTLQGELAHKEKYLLEASGGPQFESKVNSMVDASLKYVADSGMFELSVWGKNLTNELVVIYGQDLAPINFLTGDEPGADLAGSPRYYPPRMYGATLKINY